MKSRANRTSQFQHRVAYGGSCRVGSCPPIPSHGEGGREPTLRPEDTDPGTSGTRALTDPRAAAKFNTLDQLPKSNTNCRTFARRPPKSRRAGIPPYPPVSRRGPSIAHMYTSCQASLDHLYRLGHRIGLDNLGPVNSLRHKRLHHRWPNWLGKWEPCTEGGRLFALERDMHWR
jgi:hypothetical protein